jgi:dGTPase
MEAARAAAKEFLHANLYNSPVMEEAHAHAVKVVRELFAALMGDPGLMPGDDQALIPTEGLARTVADYIAGMTDSYIEQVWTKCGGTIRLTMAGSKFKLSSTSFPV